MSPPEQHSLHPRFACNGPAELQFIVDEPPSPAKIVNINAEGALVELLEPHLVYLDMLVELSFTVHHLSFRVRAIVKVIRPGDMEIGLRFFSLSHRMLAQIQELVEELAVDEGVHIPRLAPLH